MIWFVILKPLCELMFLLSPTSRAFFYLEDLNYGFLFPGTACFPEPLRRTCSPVLPIPMNDAAVPKCLSSPTNV